MKNFTSCFKERRFLVFFFKRLRQNCTGRYEDDFPFLSPCGQERNFIRCDDRPVVYTHMTTLGEKDVLCYGYAGDQLYVDFQPDHIYMNPNTGRVYHPAHDSAGYVGLVRSKLAIEFSKYFNFENGEEKCPTHFIYQGKTYVLNQEWFKQHIVL